MTTSKEWKEKISNYPDKILIIVYRKQKSLYNAGAKSKKEYCRLLSKEIKKRKLDEFSNPILTFEERFGERNKRELY